MTSSSRAKYLRYGVLLAFLAAVGAFKFLYEPSYEKAGQPYDRIEGKIPLPTVDRDSDAQRIYPSDIHGIDRDTWDAPISNWLSNETRIAEAQLSGAEVDVLVLPVQGDNNALDSIARSLVSRLVAGRIAQDDEIRVANPSSVLRYLGSNRSVFQGQEITALAELTGAERVVVLAAEHDREKTWQLSVTVLDETGEIVSPMKQWTDLAMSDTAPPSVLLDDVLDDVVEYAVGRKVRFKQESAAFEDDEFHFPESIDALAEESGRSPLHAAAYLQLLGALHPRGASNEARNHLFERSLVELQEVSPDAPYYRYFRARAYAYLGRRPAAVHALGTPANEAEHALLASLNGNLPELRLRVEKLGTTAFGFMALKDLLRIESAYRSQRERDSIEKFAEAYPAWAPFLWRSLRDYDWWARHSAATPKLALEELLPATVTSVSGELEKQNVVGQSTDEIDLARLLWRHIDELHEQSGDGWAGRQEYLSNVSALDIVDLAKAIGVANHLRRIDMEISQRVRPEVALKEIAEGASLFSGHPAVALLEGEALAALAEKSKGSEKTNLERASAESFLNGFSWSGPINRDAASVARRYWNHLKAAGHSDIETYGDFGLSLYSRRYFEWPKSEVWYYEFPLSEQHQQPYERCIEVGSTRFDCLWNMIEKKVRTSKDPIAERSTVLAAYEHRFAGHPQRLEYLVRNARFSEDDDAEEKLLRAQVAAGSDRWSMYYGLARLLKRRGDYREAQEVMLSYPAFNSGENELSVGDSNNADNAAAMFFWIGQHELALPFLELSANSGTGSGGSMSSAARIALIHGDLEQAGYWSAFRVRRYDDKYGLRDMLQILHITGHSETAWSIFDQVQSTRQDTQMWSGALVGHRAESASVTDIADWVAASEPRRTATTSHERRYGEIDLGARYLLLAGTMDRTPEPDLATTVAGAIERDKARYQSQLTKRLTEEGSVQFPVAHLTAAGSIVLHDKLVPFPEDEQHVENGAEVPHRYAMLADAMTAFLNADLEEAYRLFNETAYFYYLDEFLPYYAFSAAAIGESDHLHIALERREEEFRKVRQNEKFENSRLGYRFNENLTYAVLASFDGEHDKAVERLRRALNDRPYMNSRSIFPMYQIVDLADRLYERTGDTAYRDLALDLSRRHTVVLPMYAWAYFVVAKYSNSPVEQVDAAASGFALDPLSDRGKKLPDEIRNKAQKLLVDSGAPYLRRYERAVSSET